MPPRASILRALIRDAQKRRAKRELEAKLLEGLHGPVAEMTRDEWKSIQRRSSRRITRREDPAMSGSIHRRLKARQDLVDIFRYYAHEAGLRIAQRFFVQVEATFTRLAHMPGIGTSLRARPSGDLPACGTFRCPASGSTSSFIGWLTRASRSSAFCMDRATWRHLGRRIGCRRRRWR